MRTEIGRRNPAVGRAIALSIVALFCFQISRVYFVDQVDAFYACPYTQVWTSSASAESEADATPTTKTVEVVFASESDDRPTMRSCKNNLDGLGLSPLQPIGSPVFISPQWPEKNGARNAVSDLPAPEMSLPPRFQPPRFLS